MSSTTTTSTASTSAAAAAKRTLKLCSHSINAGGCRLGAACPNEHPLVVECARAEFETKKTLNLCGFLPNCARPGCTFLHVATAPRNAPPARAAPAARAQRTPPRSAGSANTPARPEGKDRAARPARAEEARPRTAAASRGAPKARSGRGQGQPQKKTCAEESLHVLHQIRGKVNDLEKTRLSHEDIVARVHDPISLEKADRAQKTLTLILEQLVQFAGTVDEHLAALGAAPSPADESAGTESPESGEERSSESSSP